MCFTHLCVYYMYICCFYPLVIHIFIVLRDKCVKTANYVLLN